MNEYVRRRLARTHSLRADAIGFAVIAGLNISATTPGAYAAAPQLRTQAPGFYRMMLGVRAVLRGEPRGDHRHADYERQLFRTVALML